MVIPAPPSPKKTKRALGFIQTGKYGFQPPKGEKAVGWRIGVWWGDDKRFYPGYVSRFRPNSGKYHIEYDDGDVEWLNLEKEKLEWFVSADTVLASVSIDEKLL